MQTFTQQTQIVSGKVDYSQTAELEPRTTSLLSAVTATFNDLKSARQVVVELCGQGFQEGDIALSLVNQTTVMVTVRAGQRISEAAEILAPH